MRSTLGSAARRVFTVNAADGKEVASRGIAADFGTEGAGDAQGTAVTACWASHARSGTSQRVTMALCRLLTGPFTLPNWRSRCRV